MTTRRSYRFISRVLLLPAIALLPGCDLPWTTGGKKKEECPLCWHGAQVADEEIKVEGIEPGVLKETIISFDGKPVATGEEFERNIQMMMEAQPALKDMLPYIPQDQQDQIYTQVLETMGLEKLMQQYNKDSGVAESAEYQKNARRVHEAVDRDLALRAFENEISKQIEVTEDEAKKFYQDNRTSEPIFQRPPFLTKAGGIKAKGFEVATEKEAKDLAEKARKQSFTTVAKDAKKTIVDYGLVNQHSFLDTNVKNEILSATQFPTIKVVKGTDNKYRVVDVVSRQEPTYAEPDKVADTAKEVLKGKKFNERSTQKINELKEKYKMQVNKDYVQKRKKPTVAPIVEEPVSIPSAPAPTDVDKEIGETQPKVG